MKKEMKIIYEEVIQHEFPVDAESLEAAPDEFDRAAFNGELDFSHGYPSVTQVIKVIGENGEELKVGDSYGDLESEVLRLEQELKNRPERTFLINWVKSDSFSDGRETFPLVDTDATRLTELAYKHYKDAWEDAASANALDADDVMLTQDEFKKIMDTGFRGESDYALINADYCHILFEGYSFPIFPLQEEPATNGKIPVAMPAKPCIVINHSFDADTIVYEYDTEGEAIEALKRHYRIYMEEEERNNSLLNDSECFCEDDYARITWADGCKTEFTLTYISKEV